MDLFTHFMLPYFIMMALRRPQAERLAAGLGGWAPDFDTALAWTTWVSDDLYFLGHRGLSHSLLGAPIFAFVVMGLVSIPYWRRLSPRMEVWRFTPRLVLIAMAASYTHLWFDWLTIWGIPAFYPWAVERVSLNWFFYSVNLAFLVSGYLVYRLARGTWNDRVMWKGAAFFVAAFAISGAVRYATYPEDTGADQIHPGNFEWRFTTYTYNETLPGWEIGQYNLGKLQRTRAYNETIPENATRDNVVATVKASDEWWRWALYAYGPHVFQVEERGDGSYNVTVLDLLRRSQTDDAPGWFPRIRDYGTLRVVVDGDDVRPRDA
ncbi:MAG TPA: metal-dependent hydrolase [Candidatus Thermoplasmatota archaeon]|nr:metal-dependent hydrolase [Candidatus Thermoplasmatota archaeon]